jgi:hypothetical protein
MPSGRTRGWRSPGAVFACPLRTSSDCMRSKREITSKVVACLKRARCFPPERIRGRTPVRSRYVLRSHRSFPETGQRKALVETGRAHRLLLSTQGGRHPEFDCGDARRNWRDCPAGRRGFTVRAAWPWPQPLLSRPLRQPSYRPGWHGRRFEPALFHSRSGARRSGIATALA